MLRSVCLLRSQCFRCREVIRIFLGRALGGVLLVLSRLSEQRSKQLEDVVRAPDHCVANKNTSDDHLISESRVVGSGAHQFDLADLLQAPQVGREFSQGNLVLVDTHKIPLGQTAVTRPGHDLGLAILSQGSRAVGVGGAEASLRNELVLAAVTFVAGVNADIVDGTSSDKSVVVHLAVVFCVAIGAIIACCSVEDKLESGEDLVADDVERLVWVAGVRHAGLELAPSKVHVESDMLAISQHRLDRLCGERVYGSSFVCGSCHDGIVALNCE